MGNLLGAYYFGSVGRGDHDDRSDLDILAVVQDGKGLVPQRKVLELLPTERLEMRPSISWYGKKRLAEMFKNGELFAWHLFRETLPIWQTEPVMQILGRPSQYRDGLKDVRSFRTVMSEIPAQIRRNKFNAIYEAGLVYVCVRNIAMSASWYLCERPDFSRYSAFRLGPTLACPISVEEFDVAMACRMAGQRGQSLPKNISGDFVITLFERIDPWISRLEQAVFDRGGR
ncbi:MAG TPA: nucleotidyltransferase domain-containing protein [Hyphomonadaceae bacterium]|nr:nucleotidyltransferase domain-containing protein [Hyphomonadaceae bacterium]